MAAGSTIAVIVETNDNQGVTSVNLIVDSADRQSRVQSPYNFEVEVLTDVRDIRLDATAFDSLTVVAAADAPPSIEIICPQGVSGLPQTNDEGEGEQESGQETSPAASAGGAVTEGETITITAQASDNGSAALMEFAVNGQAQTVITTLPYTIQYMVLNTPDAAAPLPLSPLTTWVRPPEIR